MANVIRRSSRRNSDGTVIDGAWKKAEIEAITAEEFGSPTNDSKLNKKTPAAKKSVSKAKSKPSASSDSAQRTREKAASTGSLNKSRSSGSLKKLLENYDW